MTSLRFVPPAWAVEDAAVHVGRDGETVLEVVSTRQCADDDVVWFRIFCAECHSSNDEYDEGVPLATYGVSCRVAVPRKTTGFNGFVEVEVASPGMVEAFVLALHSGTVPGELSARNVYALLAVAVALERPSIEHLAAQVAAATMTWRTVFRAAAYAIARNNDDLLRACFSIVKTAKGKIQYERGMLTSGNDSCPVSFFQELSDKEVAEKSPYFGTSTLIDNSDTTSLASRLAGLADDTPVPSDSVFDPQLRRCYLVRRRGNDDDEFSLYDDETLSLLVTGRKGATFTFSSTKCNPSFLGEASSSLGGSRFVLHDWGVDGLPTSCPLHHRKVRAAATYTANVLGRVPNTMRVAVLVGSKPVRFRTRPARWNDKLQMWTLEFQERVKRASKKNFQLLDETNTVKLLFGKVSKNRFSLDFAPPFAPTTALFVALTTFASKLVAA